MSAATTIQEKEIQPRGLARQVSILTVRLSLLGAALLATKFYFVKELLTLLAAMAILFTFGAAICLLIVVVQEGGKRIVCKFNKAQRAWALSMGSLSAGLKTID